jgi:hypothetical protein
MIGTALALYVLVLMVFKARSERADVAAAREELVSELLRLRDAEDVHFRATGAYATFGEAGLDYQPPAHLLFQLHADGVRGWRGVIADSTLPVPPRACGVFVGDPALAPNRATVRPGVPACW